MKEGPYDKLMRKRNRRSKNKPNPQPSEYVKQEMVPIEAVQTLENSGSSLDSKLELFLDLAPEMGVFLDEFLEFSDEFQDNILTDVVEKKMHGMNRDDLLNHLCILIQSRHQLLMKYNSLDVSDSDKTHKPKTLPEDEKLRDEVSLMTSGVDKFIRKMEKRIRERDDQDDLSE